MEDPVVKVSLVYFTKASELVNDKAILALKLLHNFPADVVVEKLKEEQENG